MEHTRRTHNRFIIIIGLLATCLVAPMPSSVKAQSNTLTVGFGDRLESISARYGTAETELAVLNGITNPLMIAQGQVLALPAEARLIYSAGGSAIAFRHVIGRGETTFTVAQQYGVNEADLIRTNNLEEKGALQSGQSITVILFNMGGVEQNIDSLETLFPIADSRDDGLPLYRTAFHNRANLWGTRLYNGLDFDYPELSVVIPPAIFLIHINAPRAVAAVPGETPTASLPTPSSTIQSSTSSSPRSTATQSPPTATVEQRISPIPPTPPNGPLTVNGATITPTSTQTYLNPDGTSTPTPTITPVTSGDSGVEVRFGPLLSHFDGRLNTIDVTVINHGITPAIEGGQSYIQNNPDGGIQWVTLLGVRHNVVPLALIENAPLWKATITTSDGYVWVFPVGCVYLDILNHTGYEPTGPNTGFDWTVYDESGFYDCGNGYKATPPDIGLGGSATVPLHIYLHHPRLWELEPPPNRRVVRIDIGLYRSDGAWLGTVGSATY